MLKTEVERESTQRALQTLTILPIEVTKKKTIIINKNDNNAKADLKRSLASKTPFIGFIN